MSRRHRSGNSAMGETVLIDKLVKEAEVSAKVKEELRT